MWAFGFELFTSKWSGTTDEKHLSKSGTFDDMISTINRWVSNQNRGDRIKPFFHETEPTGCRQEQKVTHHAAVGHSGLSRTAHRQKAQNSSDNWLKGDFTAEIPITDGQTFNTSACLTILGRQRGSAPSRNSWDVWVVGVQRKWGPAMIYGGKLWREVCHCNVRLLH